MDGGRDNVVAALPAVDVIVGVNRLTQQPRGKRCDHFIGIHVGTGARSGLENIHREVLHKVTGQQNLGGLDYGLALGSADLLEFNVGLGGCGLGQNQCANELRWHALMADGEVVDCTLGLCAIERRLRYVQFAHAVTFDTSVTHQEILAPVLLKKLKARARRSPTARHSFASA